MEFLVLAEESGKSGFNLLLPNIGEIIWGAISFAALFFLLWKFAFPPIGNMIRKRSELIEADLRRAEEAKLEAEQVLVDYRKQLANAREDAAKIIEEARQNADDLRKDVLAKAETQSREIVEKGNRDIEGAVTAAQTDLRDQMSDLAIELAGRILGRELDAAAQAATVDTFIRELDDLEAKQR